MDSNIENYSCIPCKDLFCKKCPAEEDLSTIVKNDLSPFSPFNFQIKATEIEDCLMVFCEPQDRPFFSDSICSLTFTGKSKDIIKIIKNIEVNQ